MQQVKIALDGDLGGNLPLVFLENETSAAALTVRSSARVLARSPALPVPLVLFI